MNHYIDFSSISLRDTLDPATAIEEEAQERYEEFAEQLEAHHSPEVAKFFRFMSENEIRVYDFYHQALPSVSDDEVNALFARLRNEEVQHQKMIKEIIAKVPDMDAFDPADSADEPTAQ